MKLLDYLLLSASVGFFIIGVDQVIRRDQNEVTSYYWIFMLSVVCLLLFNLRKNRAKQDTKTPEKPSGLKKPKRK